MPRNFTNTASGATLAAGLAAGGTSVALDGFAGFPAPSFTATIDRNQPTEEIVLVTAVNGNTVTLTRGYDGSVAQAHSVGATFEHTAVAADFRDTQAALTAANAAQAAAGAAQTAANTANTDLGTHTAATAAHGATGEVVGTTNAQVLTNKTLKGAVLQKADGSALTLIESAEKGAPSGVAALGADGKVPAGQLPAAGGVVLEAFRIAQTTVTATGGVRFDMGMPLTGLTPGTWRIEAEVLGYSTASNASVGFDIKAANGLVAPTAASALFANRYGSVGTVFLNSLTWNSANGVSAQLTNGTQVGAGASLLTGLLVVTTGGDLAFSAFAGATGSYTSSSWIRATKVA